MADPSTPVLHDPDRCETCARVREAVASGEIICYGQGDPCELCTATHQRPAC